MSEDESPQVSDDTPLPQVRDAYNRANKRASELEGQVAGLEQMKRENAMLKAGVDLSSPLGTLFLDGYKGELDPDAIKTAWSGLPSAAAAPTPSPETEAPDPEALRRQQEREALHNGSVAPGSEPPADPVDAAYKVFHDGMKRGMSRDRAAPAAIDVMLKAAMDGDERMIYDPQRYRDTH
jgi:hypothetical protein